MLTKEEKNKYREQLFRHLDGIAVAPVAYSLKEKGVLDYLLKKNTCDLLDIRTQFHANEGYLNVGLRMLASQGWLQYKVDNKKNTVSIAVNDKSELAFKEVSQYKDVVNFLKISEEFHPRSLDKEQFLVLNRIFNKFMKKEYASN